MSEALDPVAFAAKFNLWKRGTMLEAHGTRFLRAGEGQAVAQLDFKPELAQLTGRFHAGALIALADEAATAAALWEVDPSGELDPQRFPLTFQLSANLLRNTDRGTLTAEAQLVHRGRTTLVAQVRVSDDQGRLLALVTATLLVPQAGR
ncbi:MAG: hypothetical protein KatS3mg131_0966 [Candidatus Tectimicrobiota bacterium]|nr:MAG: hypothetical protein KatS3mg131_0966 [Candidatus Tectomicrobia bacterium]